MHWILNDFVLFKQKQIRSLNFAHFSMVMKLIFHNDNKKCNKCMDYSGYVHIIRYLKNEIIISRTCAVLFDKGQFK